MFFSSLSFFDCCPWDIDIVEERIAIRIEFAMMLSLKTYCVDVFSTDDVHCGGFFFLSVEFSCPNKPIPGRARRTNGLVKGEWNRGCPEPALM